MVSNVGANKSTFGDLTAKLQERQKALESLNAQKQAVMQELDNANSDIQVREGITAEDKNKLADYVVAYQNLKAPDVVNAPGDEPVLGDDENAYDTAHRQWEQQKAQYDQYQQDLEKYNNQKAALENKINEYKAIDSENQDFLTKLNDIADAKEKELIQAQGGIDVNTGDIERLNQEIANMKDISFGVEQGDSKGYYAAVQRQFAALQEAGIIPADADQKDFTPQELAKLANKLVELDKANGTVGENDNGMSSYYRTMQEGESYGSYSIDQINALMEASGAGSINLNESFGISMDELDKLGSEHAETTKLNNQVSQEVQLPRGVDLPEGIELPEGQKPTIETFGFTPVKQDDGTVVYQKDGKNYTAEEVNKEFRDMETQTGGKHYQENLDEAEKLGVDIDKATAGAEDKNKALKNAIKTREKEIEDAADKKYKEVKNDSTSTPEEVAAARANSKYAVQIYRYSIDTEGMSADQIKDAVKKGEYCERHADDIRQYNIDTSQCATDKDVKDAIKKAKEAKTEATE